MDEKSEMLSLLPQSRSKWNTSKIEMVTCQFLFKIHSLKCGSEKKFQSVISNNGSQKRIEGTKFSLDAFCQICQSGFLVEGKFKSVCKLHGEKFNIYHKRGQITINDAREEFNRKITFIKKMSKDYLRRLVIINECCINLTNNSYGDLKSELSEMSVESEMRVIFLKEFSNNYRNFQSQFSPEPLNYNKAILGQLIYPASTYCESKKGSTIFKLDLNFSYISALASSDIKLPYGRRNILVNSAAERWLNNYLQSNIQKEFFVVKLSLLYKDPKPEYLPFFNCQEFRMANKNKIFTNLDNNRAGLLSFCQKCSDNYINIGLKKDKFKNKFCTHYSDKSRMITVTCLDQDLMLALESGYSIKKVKLLPIPKVL